MKTRTKLAHLIWLPITLWGCCLASCSSTGNTDASLTDTFDSETADSGNTNTDSADTATETTDAGMDTGTDTGTDHDSDTTDSGSTSTDTGTDHDSDTTDSGSTSTDTGTDHDSDTTDSGSTSTDTGTGDDSDTTDSATSADDTETDTVMDTDDADSDTDTLVPLGDVHAGMYHLGPVDFAETEWHNACAPGGGYRAELLSSTGLNEEYLAGVSNLYAEGGGVCDACIFIETAEGESVVARVVTYGETGPEDLDVSPSVYAKINRDEWPRDMTWQFAACPDTGPLYYEFQTESNIWWTSLWVRNPKVPLAKVEVRSSNHSNYFELTRTSDGTLTDSGGFGEGSFTLRVTAIDGQVIEETFDGFDPGELITSDQQFH